MGTFRIEIQAVGNHGCQREVKDGGTVDPICGSSSCPDCIARAVVQKLKDTGCFFDTTTRLLNADGSDAGPAGYAVLKHWPGQEFEVRDDLLTGVRSGNF
jgi:hypothetical protein